MERDELILVLKMQQWEKCKGELSALIALEGSHKSTYSNENYLELKEKIDDFIGYMEKEFVIDP